MICAWALSVLTCVHVVAKGFGRLLQSGDRSEGNGFGLLPHDGTTPPEVHFWICMVVALVCAEVERRAFESLSEQRPDPPRAHGDDAELGRSGSSGGRQNAGDGSSKSAAEEAADFASEAKKRYIRASEPREVRAVPAILRMMLPDVHLLVLAYSSLCLAAFGESLVPLLYGQVIDAIAIYPDMERFRTYLFYLIGTALFTGVFTGLRGSTFIVIGGRFGARLRILLFESLLRQELDFFGATKTGDVTSRLSADCQKVSDQVQLNVNVFLRSVIQVVFTLAFMVYINVSLALACFVIVPAMVVLSKVFSDYMREISKLTQDALAEANATAEEAISSIATMRAFSAEREELRRYGEGMQKYVDMVWRQARLYYVYSSLSFTFLPYITYCIILFFAAQLIHTPEGCVNPSTTSCPQPPVPPLAPPFPPHGPPPPSSPGFEEPPLCGINGANLVSFVFYMNSLFAAFQSLINIWSSLAQAVGAAEKVVCWIQRRPRILPAAVPRTPPECRGDLKLVDVTFRYALRPEKVILEGLSLHASPGEVIALCGPSGGGKSSIVALLQRFYTPEKGEVLLDDVPISALSPDYLHQRCGLVGQEPTLFARSLHDNICYGLLEGSDQPHADEVVRAASLANAHDFIASFEHGYETFIGERGTQLSGGQKQRVAIARALVRKPSVLLLDEATSALDAESEHIVQTAIDAMIEQSSMTVLLIAHRLSTVRNADRICVIKGGKLAEAGTHAELIARVDGEYSKLVQRQLMLGSSSAATPSNGGSQVDLTLSGD